MTPARFSQVDALLYGSAWRDPLARSLKVAERTVRRWASGDNPIPDGVANELSLLCRKQSERLYKMAVQLGVDG